MELKDLKTFDWKKSTLTRKQLQNLCKQASIKANQKSETLIEELQTYIQANYSSENAEKKTPPTENLKQEQPCGNFPESSADCSNPKTTNQPPLRNFDIPSTTSQSINPSPLQTLSSFVKETKHCSESINIPAHNHSQKKCLCVLQGGLKKIELENQAWQTVLFTPFEIYYLDGNIPHKDRLSFICKPYKLDSINETIPQQLINSSIEIYSSISHQPPGLISAAPKNLVHAETQTDPLNELANHLISPQNEEQQKENQAPRFEGNQRLYEPGDKRKIECFGNKEKKRMKICNDPLSIFPPVIDVASHPDEKTMFSIGVSTPPSCKTVKLPRSSLKKIKRAHLRRFPPSKCSSKSQNEEKSPPKTPHQP
eukprot:Sdes_comp19629_c0_seq1m11407